MNFQNPHPLNAIEGYENFSMLEVLIPFVDPSLKLPLALFIKFNEIRLIIKCFRSLDNLNRLGLHNPSSDPLDIICALTGSSPDLLKAAFSMMDQNSNLNPMMDMFPDFSKGFATSENPFEQPTHYSNTFGDTQNNPFNDDFEQNIQNLLAEYDLAQAANKASESDFNTPKRECNSDSLFSQYET